YRARFGVPPALPAPPPNMPQPNIVEVYEQLKITDEVAVASYANTLMITHSPSEFCLDFILDVFPRPTVTQRIYMSAAHIPPSLATLRRTLDQLQQRMGPPPPHLQQTPQPPAPQPPQDKPPGENLA